MLHEVFTNSLRIAKYTTAFAHSEDGAARQIAVFQSS